jgi:hypothetical protein
MPVIDYEPGQNPGAPGVWQFYPEGQAPESGVQLFSDGRITAAGTGLLTATMTPADYGMASWAYDPALCTGGTIAVNGGVYLSKLMIRSPLSSVAVHWSVTTAGASPLAGQNWVGIYEPDGDLLNAVNVDAAISSSGAKRSVLAAPLLAPFVWVGFVFNAATPPTLARAGSFESTPNANLSPAAYRFAKNGAGATTLPATITPASNSSSGALNWWAGIE